MEKNGKDYSFINKWSPEIEKYNFTQVPNLLISCQGHLGLKDSEMLTLVHLMTFWFDHNSKIFPTIDTLSKFSNKGYSTIQKRLKYLEDKGFIKRRQKIGSSTRYDLIPCVTKLYQHQNVCQNPPRERYVRVTRTKGQPTSYTKNKQYEFLKRPKAKNTKLSTIASERFDQINWPWADDFNN